MWWVQGRLEGIRDGKSLKVSGSLCHKSCQSTFCSRNSDPGADEQRIQRLTRTELDTCIDLGSRLTSSIQDPDPGPWDPSTSALCICSASSGPSPLCLVCPVGLDASGPQRVGGWIHITRGRRAGYLGSSGDRICGG